MVIPDSLFPIFHSLQCFGAHCVHLDRETGDNSLFSKMESRARFTALECRASCCTDVVAHHGMAGADFKVRVHRGTELGLGYESRKQVTSDAHPHCRCAVLFHPPAALGGCGEGEDDGGCC